MKKRRTFVGARTYNPNYITQKVSGRRLPRIILRISLIFLKAAKKNGKSRIVINSKIDPLDAAW